MEAYYSLIAPETIANQVQWRSKFEQIFQKYGGSYEGERKLSSKLAKKYGTSVRLLLLQQPPDRAETALTNDSGKKDKGDSDESWYALTPSECNSGNIDFTSKRFDPSAALNSSENIILEKNPWLLECRRLDTVTQFALHLPESDPLRIEPRKSNKRVAPSSDGDVGSPKIARELHPFQFVTQSIEAGPLARLHVFRKQRVRVVIRYVNAIRGTLTGILVAFDKHMNMILRDVEEDYSMRPYDSEKSNVEIEVERQHKKSGKICCAEEEWFGRKRSMKNILVRGDNVVIISKANQERKTSQSRYAKKAN